MTKAFALCADDYGLSPGVCAGIIELVEARRITAVSALTNMPRWRGHALALVDHDVDVGLHFNLTLGAPLGPMPRLAPNRIFPRVGAVIRQALLRQLPLEEIRAEFDRQFDAFEEAFGRAPDFIDGHQHVQGLPGVREIVLAALKERGLARKCWLRDSADSLERIVARREHAIKALIVSALSSGVKAAARRAGLATNDGFAGFSDFNSQSDYGAGFEAYLRAAGDAHLIMCHPGHVDEELRAADPVTTTREQELAFFHSSRFTEFLAAGDWRLARLSSLVGSR